MSVNTKHIDSFIVLFLIGYLIVLPFGVAHLAEYETLAISIISLSLGSCILIISRITQPVSITTTDIAIILLCIYEILNVKFVRASQVDPFVYYQWTIWGMMYVIARQIKDAHLFWLLYAIALSGALQSIVGLLQYTNIISSNPFSDFNVTGCFNNPGPFGGYLAAAFIATSHLFIQKKNLLWRTTIVMGFLLIGTMLLLTDSRAAWLATLVSLLYLCSHSWASTLCRKRAYRIALLISFIAIIVGLYLYKPVSADARLLIWRNSSAMFLDAPICGHGVGSFAMKHMTYQAAYFEQHPDSRFASLADNNTQAFNELITIFCEQGLVGGILMLFIIGIAFLNKRSVEVKSTFLSICVFACFSYPSDVLPLSILFPLCIGLLPGRVMIQVQLRKAIIVPLLLLQPSILTYFSIGSMRHYQQAFDQLRKNEPQLILPYNKEYMSRYLKFLLVRERWKEYIHWTTNTNIPFTTSLLQCDIGKSYMLLGEPKLAEQALKKAYWMVPPKVLPKYHLFLLYRDTNRCDEARRMAKEIITMKVTQVGSVYLSAKAEAKAFLEADSSRGYD